MVLAGKDRVKGGPIVGWILTEIGLGFSRRWLDMVALGYSSHDTGGFSIN